MKWVASIAVALCVGCLVGSALTLGAQHHRHHDDTLTAQTYGGSSAPKAEVGKTYTFDGGTLCVSGGFARIVAVKPRHAQGGITVVGYSMYSDIRRTRATDVVTAKCKENSDEGQRLFVKVRSTGLPAASGGYVITYAIGNRTVKTSNDNYALLCDPAEKDSTKPIYGHIIPKCYRP